MATINDIIVKFDALKPGVATDFVQRVNSALGQLIEKHGDQITKLSSSWSSEGHTYRTYGYRFLKWESGRMRGVPTIDTEYLAKQAVKYADDQIAAFTIKLVKKLGTLTDVRIADLSFNSYTFRITGMLGDRQVSVEQSRIINVSPKGNLFHQWPALIYVDGKKTSEAQFKKLA